VGAQTELPQRDVAVQVSGCRECLSLSMVSGENSCVRCDQVDYLLITVAELREEVERLRSIKEPEKEKDRRCWALPDLKQKQKQEDPEKATQNIGQSDSSPHTAEDSNSKESHEWKEVCAWGNRQSPHSLPTSAPQVPLHKRYEALEVESPSMDSVAEGPSALKVSPGSERTTCCIKTASTGKKGRVVVTSDSHLKGTEGPICRADPALREVCCLPGTRVKDIARKLPSLVWPTDYYPLLIFHVGGDETETRSPRLIKRDFRTLGQLVRGSGAQVIFSSIFPVASNDTGRSKCIQSINMWLRGRCHRHNFGFFDNGMGHMAPGLLALDRTCISQGGMRVLAQRLAGLIDWALN
ncbi:hypothetical protein N340_02425, partial [Tauraco erythrolophus]